MTILFFVNFSVSTINQAVVKLTLCCCVFLNFFYCYQCTQHEITNCYTRSCFCRNSIDIGGRDGGGGCHVILYSHTHSHFISHSFTQLILANAPNFS